MLSEIKDFMIKICDLIYKPLKILDHAIKYNKFVEPYYFKFTLKFIPIISKFNSNNVTLLIILFEILPRIFLVVFLCRDIFIFHKLENFYKIILIGLLPFIFRYLSYTIKDILNYYIEKLENKYEFVFIFEKDYEFEMSRKQNTKAVFHYERVTIKEFIEIKKENFIAWILDEVTYEYVGYPYLYDHLYEDYCLKKYNEINIKRLTELDMQETKQLFHEIIPQIIDLQLFEEQFHAVKEKKYIKYIKSSIFSIYLICWSYILIISYITYPIILPKLDYLWTNLKLYLCKKEDIFAGADYYSIRKNMITPQSISYLIMYIFLIILYLLNSIFINKIFLIFITISLNIFNSYLYMQDPFTNDYNYNILFDYLNDV